MLYLFRIPERKKMKRRKFIPAILALAVLPLTLLKPTYVFRKGATDFGETQFLDITNTLKLLEKHKKEFDLKKGDIIRIAEVNPLSGDGISGDTKVPLPEEDIFGDPFWHWDTYKITQTGFELVDSAL